MIQMMDISTQMIEKFTRTEIQMSFESQQKQKLNGFQNFVEKVEKKREKAYPLFVFYGYFFFFK